MKKKPVAAGKSSFDLIDVDKAFNVIDIKPNSTFVDLACGVGKYSFEASKYIGEKGTVYAVDLWEEGIDFINEKLESNQIKNIKTMLGSISEKLDIDESSVDSALMATVLHDLSKKDQKLAVQEVFRFLRIGAMLNIIEFKKIDRGPGPSFNIRMDKFDVENVVKAYGFVVVDEIDLGNFAYLLKFKKVK